MMIAIVKDKLHLHFLPRKHAMYKKEKLVNEFQCARILTRTIYIFLITAHFHIYT